jgi:hypothetical protein
MKEQWRDVPVGEVRVWCGVPFRRASEELVELDGKTHVRVIYLRGSHPNEDGVCEYGPGSKGLMLADEYTEQEEAF